MQSNPSQKKPNVILETAAYVVGAAFLILIWFQNCNVIGLLYDYSIMTSGSGYLRAGFHPYNDFTTPLQSLSLYAAYGAEAVFGPRYLSLAYGNLLLALLFYAGILW